MADPVIIVDYDPRWVDTFSTLRHRIAEGLAGLPNVIEHVGSTSIFGAAAKPIIDIDVVVETRETVPVAIRMLTRLGYHHVGDLGIKGREAFESPSGLPAHHLYVVVKWDSEHTRHLRFRDHLRSHPDDVGRYSTLKRSLAAKFRNDRDAYTEGKTEFVEEILRKAVARPAMDFFSKHAEDYSRSQSHAFGSDLTALVKALRPKHTELALDVATGTGFTAVALALTAKHVTAVDLTEEMLDQARLLARNRGLANVEFELGDAMKMNYPDRSFDIVTTRRAAHHFENVPGFLLEAKRVLKPGGRIGIVDMSPPEGTESFMNRIEKLRDRSHVQAFSPDKWESELRRAGFIEQSSKILKERVTFEKWLYPVRLGGKESKAVRSAWMSSSTSVRKLLKAEFDGKKIEAWMKSRIILVGSKTP